MSNSLITKKFMSLLIKKEITKMSHGLTNHNKIITNNLLAQQYMQN